MLPKSITGCFFQGFKKAGINLKYFQALQGSVQTFSDATRVKTIVIFPIPSHVSKVTVTFLKTLDMKSL